ncbi:hypothetical protein DIPPA_27051 [Diplonema papillatum]|nr:hypothetical protein DIPPA_27051 [Diplonema papillatum]
MAAKVAPVGLLVVTKGAVSEQTFVSLVDPTWASLQRLVVSHLGWQRGGVSVKYLKRNGCEAPLTTPDDWYACLNPDGVRRRNFVHIIVYVTRRQPASTSVLKVFRPARALASKLSSAISSGPAKASPGRLKSSAGGTALEAAQHRGFAPGTANPLLRRGPCEGVAGGSDERAPAVAGPEAARAAARFREGGTLVSRGLPTGDSAGGNSSSSSPAMPNRQKAVASAQPPVVSSGFAVQKAAGDAACFREGGTLVSRGVCTGGSSSLAMPNRQKAVASAQPPVVSSGFAVQKFAGDAARFREGGTLASLPTGDSAGSNSPAMPSSSAASPQPPVVSSGLAVQKAAWDAARFRKGGTLVPRGLPTGDSAASKISSSPAAPSSQKPAAPVPVFTTREACSREASSRALRRSPEEGSAAPEPPAQKGEEGSPSGGVVAAAAPASSTGLGRRPLAENRSPGQPSSCWTCPDAPAAGALARGPEHSFPLPASHPALRPQRPGAHPSAARAHVHLGMPEVPRPLFGSNRGGEEGNATPMLSPAGHVTLNGLETSGHGSSDTCAAAGQVFVLPPAAGEQTRFAVERAVAADGCSAGGSVRALPAAGSLSPAGEADSGTAALAYVPLGISKVPGPLTGSNRGGEEGSGTPMPSPTGHVTLNGVETSGHGSSDTCAAAGQVFIPPPAAGEQTRFAVERAAAPGSPAAGWSAGGSVRALPEVGSVSSAGGDDSDSAAETYVHLASCGESAAAAADFGLTVRSAGGRSTPPDTGDGDASDMVPPVLASLSSREPVFATGKRELQPLPKAAAGFSSPAAAERTREWAAAVANAGQEAGGGGCRTPLSPSTSGGDDAEWIDVGYPADTLAGLSSAAGGEPEDTRNQRFSMCCDDDVALVDSARNQRFPLVPMSSTPPDHRSSYSTCCDDDVELVDSALVLDADDCAGITGKSKDTRDQHQFPLAPVSSKPLFDRPRHSMRYDTIDSVALDADEAFLEIFTPCVEARRRYANEVRGLRDAGLTLSSHVISLLQRHGGDVEKVVGDLCSCR